MSKENDLKNVTTEELMHELTLRGITCLDPKDVFAYKIWSREDIREYIRGTDPIKGDFLAEQDEIVDAVIKHGGAWHGLTDCTDGEWDCIAEEVDSVLSRVHPA